MVSPTPDHSMSIDLSQFPTLIEKRTPSHTLRTDWAPWGERRFQSPSQLDKLGRSITQAGVVQPIVVHPVGSHGYNVIAGNLRVHAATAGGQRSLPIYVLDVDEFEAVRLYIHSNRGPRIAATKLHFAWALLRYRELWDAAGMGAAIEELQLQSGKSRSSVHNYLAIGRRFSPSAIARALDQGASMERIHRVSIRDLSGAPSSDRDSGIGWLVSHTTESEDAAGAAARSDGPTAPQGRPTVGRTEDPNPVLDTVRRAWTAAVEVLNQWWARIAAMPAAWLSDLALPDSDGEEAGNSN